ncbi:hypothetical protein AMTRI_Chr13g124040 [Amborella trichopoda]|uniref:Uncharacterized protein n=1 Tax=Amborella trichopoda TaxID=13333 RepID=U5CML6_AMBTC|nr:hornerin [Amborella trichopoda]ERN14386.1 hypothetical protein AMTR_s00033p00230550 [Amborella trichopoda]|eukprot:XP_006852919.1 hornerin [Amborella trichopoda]
MDESSEKRRERLKAMRLEAEQTPNLPPQTFSSSSSSSSLSNPFNDLSATLCASTQASRFDFYTNPVSAFSSMNRKGERYNDSNQHSLSAQSPMAPTPGQSNAAMTHATAYPMQISYNDQRQYETPPHRSGSWGGPMMTGSPFSHGSPIPGSWTNNNARPVHTSPPNFHGGIRTPNFGRGSSPNPNFGRGSSPSSNYGSRSSPHPNYGRGSSPSPSYGRGSSPSPNYGRGSSPNFSSGMGRGRHFSWSPGHSSGRGGGRGRGYHLDVSAKEHPERFYNKSMVEDPWSSLIAVTKRLGIAGDRSVVSDSNKSGTPDSLRSWLPKSISKKARISDIKDEFNSETSLADSLVLAFEDAANDRTDV